MGVYSESMPRYLHFDNALSRIMYMRYIAIRTGGEYKEGVIHYDYKGGHSKAIEIVMEDQIYGFKNHHQDRELPKLSVFDLNWSKDGLRELFEKLTEIDCLVMRHIETESYIEEFIMLERDELLREIIGIKKVEEK
jgi:hypothetical protein